MKGVHWGSAIAGALIVSTGPALAEQQDEQRSPEGEVIVTGQKRQSTLQNSDTAITVLDAKAIHEARLRDFSQLDDLVPNVQFNQGGQLGNVFITIRGVESNPFIVNRAAVYIDGIPFRELTNAVLSQVDSIEVLRGPQGTLYGANSESGLIVIRTRNPADRPERELRATGSLYSAAGGYPRQPPGLQLGNHTGRHLGIQARTLVPGLHRSLLLQNHRNRRRNGGGGRQERTGDPAD